MIDKTIELPEPWYWTQQNLSEQLQIEINSNHFLKNVKTKTLARRQDNDDVLFELENGEFVIVHLTWLNYANENSNWPKTQLYNDWEKVLDKVSKDGAEFE